MNVERRQNARQAPWRSLWFGEQFGSWGVGFRSLSSHLIIMDWILILAVESERDGSKRGRGLGRSAAAAGNSCSVIVIDFTFLRSSCLSEFDSNELLSIVDECS